MIDVADPEDLDDTDDEPAGLLNDEGLPKGRRGFRMVDQGAVPIAFNAEERARFINQIAELRQRLDRYEPEGGPAVLSIAAARPNHRLPSPAVELAKLKAHLDQARAELRVADDTIREHIRQKMSLRRQLEEAHAGRAGAGVASLAVAHAQAAAMDRHAAPAPVRPPAAAAMVASRLPAVAAHRVAVERPLAAMPAPALPAADAPMIPGKNRSRSKEGWFYHALKRIGGERTIAEVCAADQRSKEGGTAAAFWSEQRGLIERCARIGLANVYRLKA